VHSVGVTEKFTKGLAKSRVKLVLERPTLLLVDVLLTYMQRYTPL
jgi:hypothetical protein